MAFPLIYFQLQNDPDLRESDFLKNVHLRIDKNLYIQWSTDQNDF